jgi:putative PIN family toxin of toxin-antitoxin system
MLRLVLDTQVWIDWLVFDDSSTWPLNTALRDGRVQVFLDHPCRAELVRVLGYSLGKRRLDPDEQQALAARAFSLSTRIDDEARPGSLTALPALPRCADPDDQKILELAAAARADALVTRDKELLVLAKRVTLFRIGTPQEINKLILERKQTA